MMMDARASLRARDSLEQEKRTAKSDGFFAVDRGAFRCAAVGGLNSAVAHLIMARGTGRDNRTTQWSVHSIERHTGISRPDAAKGVKDLLDRGIWTKIREGQHPIYEAILGNQIPGGPFTADEQAAIVAIRDGKAVAYDSKEAIKALVARGLSMEARELNFLMVRCNQAQVHELLAREIERKRAVALGCGPSLTRIRLPDFHRCTACHNVRHPTFSNLKRALVRLRGHMEDGGETIVSARQECIAAGHRSGLVGFSLLPTSDLRRQRHREFGMGRSSIMDPVPLQEISAVSLGQEQ